MRLVDSSISSQAIPNQYIDLSGLISYIPHATTPSSILASYRQPYWQDVVSFLESEYSQQVCFPEKKNIFKALELTPVDDVRVVILGQDPYHTTGAAMGMAFAIPD
jgi:uracil-DNA glycosylase